MDDRRPARAGAQNPAYRPAHPLIRRWPGTEWSPRLLVPSLFRQSHRENRVEGSAAEVFRVGEEVPVSIHRLGDSGMTESCLDHLGVQVGSDQRRGVEVASSTLLASPDPQSPDQCLASRLCLADADLY